MTDSYNSALLTAKVIASQEEEIQNLAKRSKWTGFALLLSLAGLVTTPLVLTIDFVLVFAVLSIIASIFYTSIDYQRVQALRLMVETTRESL